MTKTVTIAATRAGGEPYAHHDVIVTLVAGSAGGVVGSNVIVEQSTVKLNNLGQGSVVLQTNDVEITSPSTSFYRLTVADSSPTITRSIRVTDDLPSTVAWTLADIQVGDPTIPQRDVSSDYVTIGGQSLTNYLASRTSAGFTVPLVGQWNVGGDQVLSLLAQFTDITPHFGTPTTDVDIAVGTTITGDVGVADIPNAWTHLPPAQPPESYVGFNLSVGVVEQVVGLGVPFWGRNIYIFGDSEWTATVHFFYRDGFPADSTGDVDVVIIADGIAHEITVPGSPVGEEGAPASAPFPLRAMPPTAGQQIIDGDTSVTGIEGTIVNNGPNGTAITAVLPRPAPGTELAIVTGANDGVFDADGDDVVVAATGATASTYALPARSVVTLGFLDGAWTVLDDTSTGGGGVALGETSTTAYRGDRGKTAYDHSQLVTGNPHGTTATDVGAQPVDSDLTAIAALTTTSYGRAFLALADAAAGRTALGLGTAALSATGDFATAGHNHSGTYQPLDSDLTALAALTTTSFGRALLELADAAAARTAIGAMASTATLPWHDDFTVLHTVRDPLPVTGTYTQTPAAVRGGGYSATQTGTGWVLTYARIPLRAGTYTRRYVARTNSNSGIVTFTIGGISAGTADGYSVGNVNDVVFDATGIVIPSDGFYDLVLTSTTKNASSGNYQANAQFTRLFRTGA